MNLLRAKNKTPEQVADTLGISPRAVYYWFAGKREPRFTVSQIQALCSLLECSVHELPTNFSRVEIESDEDGIDSIAHQDDDLN
ncbi:helix-turn-helix transcriptional regulator [Leptolyngbya sp. NK1-12]|uniref:Helix-turn-helix transcriptional regulator n=2 Tax=Leptolyngbya sp. NK1-12 TaxID=2547451 RepID=A0AA96WK58_9CYAN|nr:helix-turn-helix transcriptional regulator [Leptolyngbya sp. NK1-12]